AKPGPFQRAARRPRPGGAAAPGRLPADERGHGGAAAGRHAHAGLLRAGGEAAADGADAGGRRLLPRGRAGVPADGAAARRRPAALAAAWPPTRPGATPTPTPCWRPWSR